MKIDRLSDVANAGTHVQVDLLSGLLKFLAHERATSSDVLAHDFLDEHDKLPHGEAEHDGHHHELPAAASLHREVSLSLTSGPLSGRGPLSAGPRSGSITEEDQMEWDNLVFETPSSGPSATPSPAASGLMREDSKAMYAE